MKNIFVRHGSVSTLDKCQLLNQLPLTYWLTGLSGSGKTTLAYELEHQLFKLGIKSVVLDGDNLRSRLSHDLDFSTEGRSENIRRTAEVAKLFNLAGIVAITSLISPLEKNRAIAKKIIGENNFCELYLSADLATCEKRDIKGVYDKARKGEISDFTGISSLYEAPNNPELVLDSETYLPEELAKQVLTSTQFRLEFK